MLLFGTWFVVIVNVEPATMPAVADPGRYVPSANPSRGVEVVTTENSPGSASAPAEVAPAFRRLRREVAIESCERLGISFRERPRIAESAPLNSSLTLVPRKGVGDIGLFRS